MESRIKKTKDLEEFVKSIFTDVIYYRNKKDYFFEVKGKITNGEKLFYTFTATLSRVKSRGISEYHDEFYITLSRLGEKDEQEKTIMKYLNEIKNKLEKLEEGSRFFIRDGYLELILDENAKKLKVQIQYPFQ